MIDMTLVCHLRKALYGLKQAPLVWYSMLLDFLQELGFTKTDANQSVFISYDKSMFISVYVDDLFITGGDLNIINDLMNKLSERFCMTDLGLVSHYLSMSVTQK